MIVESAGRDLEASTSETCCYLYALGAVLPFSHNALLTDRLDLAERPGGGTWRVCLEHRRKRISTLSSSPGTGIRLTTLAAVRNVPSFCWGLGLPRRCPSERDHMAKGRHDFGPRALLSVDVWQACRG